MTIWQCMIDCWICRRLGENKNWFVMTEISGMSSNMHMPKHPTVKAHSSLGGKQHRFSTLEATWYEWVKQFIFNSGGILSCDDEFTLHKQNLNLEAVRKCLM